MTDKQIIDGTQCIYAHFEGGNTQRLLCAIDDCFCDCYRENECYYKQLKRKEQECEELKEAIKIKTGKDYINEIQDITMKYECHQKSMGVCWWGKYGKETKCVGIKECHKRELEVIQNLETTIAQLKKELASTKGLVTVGNKQLTQVLKENEELEKLYKKLEGSCLIGKHWRFE